MLAKILAPVFTLSGWMWTIMPYFLIAGGLFFTLKTKGVQFKMVKESIRLLTEKNEGSGISPLGAFCVSTASRVGTGNVIGVATAIATGGPGALFWMWITALIGGATAFVESTLAQIYKKKDPNGGCYGGPAYYIETALHSRPLAVVFAISLIFCYGIAFNMLASYNLQSVFDGYSFYNPSTTPAVIGGIVALATLYIILGGGKRIASAMNKLVPVMGIFYTLVAIVCIILNIGKIPAMIGLIFKDAFNFKAIFGGWAGSCIMLGFKRGLYSNEAGVGSAPNAAAANECSHPVKQGLVQMLSVYCDTLILCTATGLLCLSSGINPIADGSGLSGAAYARAAAAVSLGGVGPTIVVIALVLFAFSTLCGNFFFIENCIAYINKKMPSKTSLIIIRVIGAVIIFIGAIQSAGTVWDLSDFMQAVMTVINIPVCVVIGGVAYKALDNYVAQRKAGKNPVFKASDIGLNDKDLDYWH